MTGISMGDFSSQSHIASGNQENADSLQRLRIKGKRVVGASLGENNYLKPKLTQRAIRVQMRTFMKQDNNIS